MGGTDIYEKAMTLIRVWGSMRADKTFFRMTLEDFTKLVEPSAEARREIAELEDRMQKALSRRDDADRKTRRAIIRVVNGVKGDADEGEDSELLAAMGYLPHTARSSINSLARKSAARARAAVNEEVEAEE